jgi:hypothetical protein
MEMLQNSELFPETMGSNGQERNLSPLPHKKAPGLHRPEAQY